jgi:hypothetical protein
MSYVTYYCVLSTDLISLVSTDSLTTISKGIFLFIKIHSCVDCYKIVDHCNDSTLTAHT